MPNRLVQGLLDLLWPPRTRCAHCDGMLGADSAGGLLCGACWASMGFPPGRRYCFHCARPLPGQPLPWGWQAFHERRVPEKWQSSGVPPGWAPLCPDCARGSPFGRIHALGLHEGALRKAVHLVKYEGREELGILLGRRLGGVVTRRPDYIVPVPLHPSRLRERGYNQAALIARGIGEVLGVPVVEGALVRHRRTARQADLDRRSRLQNLQQAFGPGCVAAAWFGRLVLLVDDVLTTGATASAAATVLWETGAAEVDLAVLAVSATPVWPH